MKSQIMVIIKPWSLQHAEEILNEFDKHGTRIKTSKINKLKLEDLAIIYERLKQEPYYGPMVADCNNKPAVIALYEGRRTEFDELKDQLRTRFAFDIPPHPKYQRNAIHTSLNYQEFKKEFSVFKKYLQLS